jgi:hypothetical protein
MGSLNCRHLQPIFRHLPHFIALVWCGLRAERGALDTGIGITAGIGILN